MEPFREQVILHYGAKMKKDEFNQLVKSLIDKDSDKYNKYQRNLQRYSYSYGVNLSNISRNGMIGMNLNKPVDCVEVNVIKSIIDTLTNRIASLKAIPFFTTVNGDFMDRQRIKAIQRYFETDYEKQHLQIIVPDVFRDACIFDTGYVYIDSQEKKISRVLPWQIYYDPAEVSYNTITKVLWKQEQFPIQNKNTTKYITRYRYWDIANHKYIEYIPDTNTYKESEYDKPVLPIRPLYFDKPILGSRSVSIVDQLRSIQYELDITYEKIRDAFRHTNPQIHWIPEDSNGPTVNIQELDNGAGLVATYRPIPGMTNVPIIDTIPGAIDPQFFSYVQQLRELAYNQIGISEMSAIGRKDSGLDSGVAIKTVQQIEGDRFQINQDLVLEFYKDITKTIIQLFDGDVLPKSKDRPSITWNDVREEEKNMKIQFSCADAMSEDPQTKAQQIEMLKQLGVPKNELIALTEIPDIDRGFTIMTNAFDAVSEIINSCVEEDSYEVPSFVPYQMLMDEIQSTQLNLTACGYKKNKATIDKLQKLYNIVEKENQGIQQSQVMDQAMGQAVGQMAQNQMAQNQEGQDLNLQSDPTSWRNSNE